MAKPSRFSPIRSGDETLDRAQDAIAKALGAVSSVAAYKPPPGLLLPYAGSAAPAGYLLCDGRAVDRTQYAALFAVVGIVYGPGDGRLTFNLPDLRSRMPVGAGQGAGLSSRALAATGGEESHALSAAELAAHSHGVTDPGHAHQVASRLGDTTTDTAATNRFMSNGPADASTNPVVTNSATATTGITTQSAGTGAAHNTMPPFLAVNWLIST